MITDNDKDYATNITNNYSEYTQNQFQNIHIFADKNNERYTFEVCIYNDNQAICDAEFNTHGRQLSIREYMIKNKTEAAYILLKNRADALTVPQYIQDAIRWIDA